MQIIRTEFNYYTQVRFRSHEFEARNQDESEEFKSRRPTTVTELSKDRKKKKRISLESR